jgi:ABC-type transport system involved in multi-copper enzyme maturation permease subunit
MIRFTWLQFRTQALVGFALLVVAAIVLAISGAHLAHVNDAFLSACRAADDCSRASNPVLNAEKSLQSAVPVIVTITPAIIGMFLGAPLIAHELETGTYRLIWTQGATRQHWLAVKLGLVGLGAMVLGGLLTWMADWWASPLDAANQNRFGVADFGLHGVAPIG